jgi:hypothetical protein
MMSAMQDRFYFLNHKSASSLIRILSFVARKIGTVTSVAKEFVFATAYRKQSGSARKVRVVVFRHFVREVADNWRQPRTTSPIPIPSILAVRTPKNARDVDERSRTNSETLLCKLLFLRALCFIEKPTMGRRREAQISFRISALKSDN